MGTRLASAPSLGPLETDVMEVLWQRDAATVRHVLDVLNAGGSKIRAYTTVMTALHHLDRKRLVIRRRNGKADVYRPRISRSAYRTSRAEAQAEALIELYGDAAYLAMARCMNRPCPASPD